MKPKTVSTEVYDELRRERDSLKRETVQLRAALKEMEMAWMNDRRQQMEHTRREAQRRATAAIFAGCGND